jgi:uncharacterized repeat protein (TIGR04076 family)
MDTKEVTNVMDLEDSSSDEMKRVMRETNRYYQEVTITKVTGDCPFGHKEGEQFKATSANTDGLCGALYHTIHPYIIAQHNGGEVPWGKESGVFTGMCPEMGKVQIKMKRIAKGQKRVKKIPEMKDMTGKGFPGIDKYRIFLEIIGTERHCFWGHKPEERFEVDPFNVGRACGYLWYAAYPQICVVSSGAKFPWDENEGAANTTLGVCPDFYDLTSYRIIREER